MIKRLIALLILASGIAFAQGWSGLDASRKDASWPNTGHIDLTTGVWNGIPSTYTTPCATVTPSADTSGASDTTNINNAIAGCTSGQYVYLHSDSAHPFYVNYVKVNNHSNVVIRGDGPLSTYVLATSGTGTLCAFNTNFCITGSDSVSFVLNNIYGGTGARQANWTNGLTAGSTTLTFDKVGSSSNLMKAGQLLVLDQNNNQVGITYISGDGATATVHTFLPHGFSNGDTIGIGCSNGGTGYANYNGWKTVTVVDTKTFTYSSTNTAACNGSPAAAAWSSGTTYAFNAIVLYNNVAYKSYSSSNTNHQPDLNITCSPNPCSPWWAVVPGGAVMKDPWNTAEPLFMEDTDYVGRSGTGQLLGRSYDGTDRSMQQTVYVQSVDSVNKTATVTPPVYLQGINSGQDPGATWFTPVSEVGIENLTLDVGNNCPPRGTTASAPARTGTLCSTANQGVTFNAVLNGWMKNVRVINCYRQCVAITGNSSHVEIRDSYFFFTWLAGSESYGVEVYTASDTRIENNICDYTTNCVLFGPSSGAYVGYNYSHNNINYAGSGQFQGAPGLHDPGITFTLWEGNIFPNIFSDSYWGTGLFSTEFRNWKYGVDQLGPNPPVGVTKTAATAMTNYLSFQRYNNFAGNVYGPTDNTGGGTYPGGFYSVYKAFANSSCAGVTQAQSEAAVFLGGFGGSDITAIPSGTCDTHIDDTSFRWGNFDVVTNAARWCGNSSNTGWLTTCGSASEVPTGLIKYSNAIPSSETVPASMVYGSQPSWWISSKGTIVWPPIGPDVTGSQGPGNHATKIPAQLCWEGTTKTAVTQGSLLNFDANNCYSGTPPPFVVSIVPSGNGSGTVTGDDGMSCTITAGVASGVCSEQHNANDTPTYTRTATSGSFLGWSGPCSGTGATCQPTVPSGDLAVGVNFTLTPTSTLSCPNGCAVNCGAAISLTGTITNVANQGGSSWLLTDPNGTIVLGCSYGDGSGCSLNGGTTSLTLLTGGIYQLQAISGGVPSTPSTQNIILSSCVKGNVLGKVN